MEMTIQLNTYIARSGFCARRKAANYIKDGKVHVNGSVIRQPWHKIRDRDVVTVSGKKLIPKKHVYLVMNKPKGVTTTLEDRFAGSKITDLISPAYGRVYPVGRLDKDSSGLILLTNDGDLCYRLTHPKFEIEKEYRVIVEGEVGEDVIKRLESGFKDGEDLLKIRSCDIVVSKNNRTELKITAGEGKKRHIRRMCRIAALKVLELRRVRIGSLLLGKLPEGAYKAIERDKIYSLFSIKAPVA